jgi:hypothetical protein
MSHSYRDEYLNGNRSSHIYYIFTLYRNEKFIGEKIEGKIYNPINVKLYKEKTFMKDPNIEMESIK